MLSSTTVFSVLLGIIVVVLQESGCHGYPMMAPYQLNANYDDHPSNRREQVNKVEDSVIFPKLASEIFGSSSQENPDRNQFHEDNDSSISSDETSEVDLPLQSSLSKRRNGPTLSVVNPLEILRQRLKLDLAQRRIHEHQKQIIANSQLLENIGKRSTGRQTAEGDLSQEFEHAQKTSVVDLPHQSTFSKRRSNGPTLSVVNPLEILRQRLMLDLARRRIHENQQQIVANAQLLENIGKRSSGRQSAEERARLLGDGEYRA